MHFASLKTFNVLRPIFVANDSSMTNFVPHILFQIYFPSVGLSIRAAKCIQVRLETLSVFQIGTKYLDLKFEAFESIWIWSLKFIFLFVDSSAN